MRSIPSILLLCSLLAIPAMGQSDYDLSYSSYLGGSSWEHARDVYTDSAGFTYVVGGTASSNFTSAPTGTYAGGSTATSDAASGFGGCDAFVTKLSPSGQVQWTRLLGGSNYDRAYAVEVDQSGNIYVGGRAGIGFPTTPSAFQPTFAGTSNPSNYGNQNGFVSKLSSSGDVLWSSYVGTGELVRDLAIDDAGDVYVPLVMSNRSSRTLPAAFNNAFANAYKPTPPTGVSGTPAANGEVGVAKLKGDGTGVVWATWLSGRGDEGTNASIRVTPDGKPYVLFHTLSDNTSLTSVGTGSQTNNAGGRDGYLAAVNATGSGLTFGTYVGGSGTDSFETHSLAIDSSGNAVISMHVDSNDFVVTTGPSTTVGNALIGNRNGSNDIAIIRIDQNGSKTAARLMGGSGGENPDGIYLDSTGRVFLSAETSSSDFPITTSTAWQPTFGGVQDAVITLLSPDLSTIEYGTYFGGTAYDNGRASFLGTDGSLFVVGGTLSNAASFPLLNAFDGTYGGGSNAFAPGSGDSWIAKFSSIPEPSSLALILVAAGASFCRRRRT